ncbi:MAG: hypothetical protein RLZZ332_942 [Actinomycetota bacterium]
MSDGRFALARVIGVLVIAAGAAALLGVVVGGNFGRTLDIAALGALAIAPGVRLVVLMVSWVRQRDYKYALAALGLILLIVVSVIGTSIWR